MLGDLLVLILKTAFGIVLIALVARFLAQIARADVHNPLAQTVLKITNPFLTPLRRVIPGVAGLDIAALVCIWVGQIILACLVFAAMGTNPAGFMGQIAIWSLLSVAGLILTVLFWGMIIVAIGSWIAMGQPNPMLTFLGQIIEPFVGPFRRLNLQVGMLDLSFIIAILVLIIIRDFFLRGMILSGTGIGQMLMYNLGGHSPVIGL